MDSERDGVMVRKPPYSLKRLVNVYKVRLNVYKTTTGASLLQSSPCLSLSRPHTIMFHLISLVFLFLTVHPVFSNHHLLLTSCRSLALTLFFDLQYFHTDHFLNGVTAALYQITL